MAGKLFIIGETLRPFLESLQEALDVRFSNGEVERLFAESEADRVSAKRYAFFHSAKLSVLGLVDKYEPETVWIQVEGICHHETAFQNVVDNRRPLIGPDCPIH
jgi:hypothetical protein